MLIGHLRLKHASHGFVDPFRSLSVPLVGSGSMAGFLFHRNPSPLSGTTPHEPVSALRACGERASLGAASLGSDAPTHQAKLNNQSPSMQF
jgi:hypothetical protein